MARWNRAQIHPFDARFLDDTLYVKKQKTMHKTKKTWCEKKSQCNYLRARLMVRKRVFAKHPAQYHRPQEAFFMVSVGVAVESSALLCVCVFLHAHTQGI